MQHSISCANAGVNCPFVARDESIDGAVHKLIDHVQDVHAKVIQQLLEAMTADELTQWLTKKVVTEHDPDLLTKT